MPVPFSEVLEFFESHGWALKRIQKPYFVFFDDPYDPQELPFLVQVDENKEVSDDAFQRIRRFFGEEEG